MAARSARLALGGCAAVLALAACSAGSSTTIKHASPAAGRSSPGASGPATPAAASPKPVIAGEPGAPPKMPGWLSPAQIMAAYDTGPLLSQGITGKGQTIAIIFPFGSPTIRQDLTAYDRAWHLPAPPSFRIITPLGPIPPFRPTTARTVAAGEVTLDVEAAHLMAPGASLLLVEIPQLRSSLGIRGVVKAMVYVIRHHLASVMSLSLASAEGNNLASSLRRYHRAILAAGRTGGPVTIVAATGDLGAAEVASHGRLFRTPQVTWPASDPLVVAVGGTKLELGAQAPGDPVAPATSWPGSNGGRSTVFARPSYQSTVAGVAGRRRAVPDISLDAAPGRALEMYATPRSIGFPRAFKWSPSSGASLATPLFAGVVALAGQMAGRPLGLINPLLYQLAAQHDPGIVDVQGQGNTFRAGHITVRGFPAGPGYDLVTGLGTIDAAKFVPDLVRLALRGVR
jgi:subtilase family serine protease